jgi:benzoyl-CoA-dihydrodiol lyase
VFCTLAEGIKGQRAVDWGLVDTLAPRSRFDEVVLERAKHWTQLESSSKGPGIQLLPLSYRISEDEIEYQNVKLSIDRNARVATVLIKGPQETQPANAQQIREKGSAFWPLQTFRELDHALLHLRFNEAETGVLLLKTQGDLEAVRKMDALLAQESHDWLVHEILLFMKRTLKRLDLTARTMFALIEPGSCFAGSLFELALAADRSYMLDNPDEDVAIALTELNQTYFPMSNGLTRIQTRFLSDPDHAEEVFRLPQPMSPRDAEKAGLVTFAIDDLDYEDDVRVAIEERASLSPDALTGMEANLRFAGPETMETKIFGRLSAWQNWIFIRPNAVGEHGALKLYGSPQRPAFDWKRT